MTEREPARGAQSGGASESASRAGTGPSAGAGVDEQPPQVSVRHAVPGLARVAFGAYWNTAGWAAGASMRAGSRVLRAAATGEAPARLIADASDELRAGARRLLGVGEPSEPQAARQAVEGGVTDEELELRTQGAQLLRRSADVRAEDGFHPAYSRILTELAPDEARVLRLLATGGPQPAVDVRTWRPLGIGDALVAAGLSMIASEAGLLRPERIHPYLDNLARLGLVWFPHEPLPDPRDYQVLEAQPDVGEAMRSVGRARTLRRSIQLTSFGVDFCRAALPLQPPARDEGAVGPEAGVEAEPASPGDPLPPEPQAVEPAAFDPSPAPSQPARGEA